MKTNRLTDIEKKLSALPEAPSLFDDLSEKDRNFNRAMVEIALAIKNERIFRGLTQKEFADFLEVKQTQVSRWESGDHNFTTSTLYAICDKLNPRKENKTWYKQTIQYQQDVSRGSWISYL